jgi:hypothetical protein
MQPVLLLGNSTDGDAFHLPFLQESFAVGVINW